MCVCVCVCVCVCLCVRITQRDDFPELAADETLLAFFRISESSVNGKSAFFLLKQCLSQVAADYSWAVQH